MSDVTASGQPRLPPLGRFWWPPTPTLSAGLPGRAPICDRVEAAVIVDDALLLAVLAGVADEALTAAADEGEVFATGS